MAKLVEHQGKRWLREAGIAVPTGRVVRTPDEARLVAEALGRPVVVKGQVTAGGRGKAGIVKLAATPDDAFMAAGEILNRKIGSSVVRELLVEEKLEIQRECYCSVVVSASRTTRSPLLMFSTEGGVDIESVPEELLRTMKVNPVGGLQQHEAAVFLEDAGLAPELVQKFALFLTKLAAVYRRYDCQTLEINPLVLTRDGELVCADCKMEIDNAAVFRQRHLGITMPRDLPGEVTELDRIGWSIEETDSRGTGFLMNMGYDEVSPGYIGYHPIGGGSAMMGFDVLSQIGLRPANYADTSGNPVASKVYRVAKSILSQPNIEGYLLGGFLMANQEQWHHAHALVKVLREVLPERKPGLPCVLLLCGNKEDESLDILRRGLADLMTPDGPGRRVEIYGKEFVTAIRFIGERLLTLCNEYRAEVRCRKEKTHAA